MRAASMNKLLLLLLLLIQLGYVARILNMLQLGLRT